MSAPLRLWILSAFVLAHTDLCRGQCAEWDDTFFAPGIAGSVNALAIHDDGSGPALYVAGGFWAAGRVHATNIVKWDGATWSPLGTGVNGIVHALTVFDDGTGPALYAGGLFTVAGGASANRVARWDGAAWSALGTGVAGREAIVRALTVFDDGTGAALYAAGSFATAGGVSANKIAKWDGSSWSALGVGFDGMDPGVYAMAVHDDGSGSALFVGGNFDLAGGASANHVAKWDGSTWSDVGGGMTGNADMTVVNALTVFDDGSGAALHAGGLFTDAGGIRVDNIAKWNGTSWSALASGLSGNGVHLQALTVFDDGAGSALYAAGFPGPGFGWAGIAKWNGSTWSEIDGPFGVLAFIAFDAGSGLALYAGGSFAPSAGTIPYSIARWDGTNWSALVDDWNGILGTGVPEVNSFAVFDDGSGSALYAAGSFQHAGSLATSNIARWNGSSWSQLDGGYGGSSGRMFAAAVFDDGSGPALFVGGSFDHPGGSTLNVTRWNGSTWSPPGGAPGTGTDGTVLALTVFDDGSGPALYAAGQFSAAGGAAASRIAKWNGSSWAALGVGVNDDVHALEVFDDGSGLALYAGGAFTTAGGAAASRIAKWNGSSWSALGTGVNGFVRALKAFDDGSGPALCVGGSFTTAGGAAASRIARWNGSGWATLGVPPFDGPNGSVYTLAELNDGSGAALYVGGGFQAAGGLLVANITKWDGSSWSALATNGTAGTALAGSDGGITWGGARVIALVVFDDGADGAPELYAGGRFEYAGAQSAMHIAKWHRCPPGTAYCFGDGLDPVVTALCPCSNFGEPGHGCANSNPSLGGARLWATGTTSPNTLLFICEGIPNNALATFWRGTANTPGGGVVHDGIQCLGGTTIRFGQQNAGQLGNPPFTISAGTVALAPGSTRYYQVLYRNPAPAFCPPGTYNFSNGYIVTW